MTEHGDTLSPCPSCGSTSHATVKSIEHLYPPLFPGVPTFWPFMAPALARAVTAGIGLVGMAVVVLAVDLVSRGALSLAVAFSPVVILTAYVFVACVKALGQHHRHACGTCGLDRSRPGTSGTSH